MRRIKRILFLAGTIHLALSADEIRPVAATRTDRSIEAATVAGRMQLAAREVQVEVLIPDRKESKGAILVIFDPSSGLFLGQFSWIPGYPRRIALLDGFLSAGKTYLGSDRITCFTLPDAGVYVRESKEKAASLDDAEAKTLKNATDHLSDYVAYATRGPVIPLDQLLGREFASEPGNARRASVRLTDVSRRDGKWEIMVAGRWRAKVILNEKYEVTSTERIQ